MKQKTFHFYKIEELEDIFSEIHADEAYINASGVLVQLYNPRLDMDEVLLLNTVKKGLPHACISGVTSANIAGETFDISQFPVELSVTCFAETKLYQYDFDMERVTSFVAGRIMNETLGKLEDTKCLQVFYASTSASIGSFLFEFNHHKLPIFGIKAGRSITRQNTAHVYGRKVYSNGFVVIAFLSKSLRLYMDNNLGWQPIGVEMVITETEGSNTIVKIDDKPAIDIFSKYLKVSPNEYFVHNVCEFPLILKRDGCELARVPAGYTNDGSVIFTSEVRKGDHFRLSYADKEKLNAQTEKSSRELGAFQPDAVFIFECGNRVRYLKQNYLFEIMDYRNYAKQLSAVTGYAEVFVTPEGHGGDCNSTLVAVGLKEDINSTDSIITHRSSTVMQTSVTDTNKEIPFIERILAFLESTSNELDEMNRELGKIAYTDQLTKIYNRWELEKAIEEALVLSKQGKPYGLLFFDIDHFKHVNDTYGHDVGDLVLLAMVNLIREQQESRHVFGRWGGEEFIYLLPDVDEKSLFDFAEKLRKTIDEVCFVTVQHITISIGATLALPDDTPESFVKRADNAVYEAKETGRNKVVLK